MRQIHELSNIAETGDYRRVWKALLAETPGANFFQSLEWLEVYWKHFGEGQQLRVLVVLEDSRPVGIMPLVVRTEETKVGLIRFLTYPMDYWGSFYGPIGHDPELILDVSLDHLRRSRRDWDVLELRWAGGPIDDANWIEQTLRSHRFQALKTELDQTAIVRLDGTWVDYLGSRRSKWRANYRRWQRRLEEAGELEYLRYRPKGELYDDGDPRRDLYEACLTLASKSWQGASDSGTTLTHDEVRPFLADVHDVAARSGALDLNLLYSDGQAIAFAYNYCYNGYVYGLRVGYDAGFRVDGAGNLLYARIIEDSFRRGDWLYDLGPGSLACKRYLNTEVRPILRYSHFASLSLRTQLLRLKRHLDGTAISAAFLALGQPSAGTSAAAAAD